jgi:hypothetical protein
MKNLKLELFKFKNNLTLEQLEISKIAQSHLEEYDNFSELEINESLKTTLKPFTYDPDVKLFLESVQNEVDSYPLVMELKDLYKKVERKNFGQLYRQPLIKLLEIINKDNDDSRVESVINELAMYDWIPEIKHFLIKMNSNPVERQNLINSGKGEKVYTLVEKVENGHLAFISNRWFLIGESDIKQVIAEDYIKDEDKIREIRILEKVLQMGDIQEDVISFKIDENLVVSVSTKNKSVSLNGTKLDKETTLETLFNSPLIPLLKRDYYNLVESTLNNADKFVDLDIALKVTNILNQFNESVVFNYKDKMYMYSDDKRYGSRFYTYENASEIIQDVQKDLDYDLSKFFENKLSDELKTLRNLEDKEKQVDMKLKDVNESIELLKDSNLIKEDLGIEQTFNNLLILKKKLSKELYEIKENIAKTRKSLIK